MIIGSIIGFLIGLIGVLLAAPLDALAIKLKAERLKNSKGLVGRLYAKGTSLKHSSKSLIGKANTSNKTPKLGANKDNKNSKKDKKGKEKKEEKEEQTLEDRVKQKKEDLKSLLKESALQGTAQLIRTIFSIIGSAVCAFISTFFTFILAGLIIALLVGYIYSYINMYTVITPATETTAEKKTFVSPAKTDDEGSGGFWASFLSALGVIQGEGTRSDDIDNGSNPNPSNPDNPDNPENPENPETPTPSYPIPESADNSDIVAEAARHLGQEYDQGRRTGFPPFDCSSFCWYCLNVNGYQTSISAWNTGSAITCMQSYGWEIPMDLSILEPGDILWRNGHMTIYVGGDDKSHDCIGAKGKKWGVAYQSSTSSYTHAFRPRK